MIFQREPGYRSIRKKCLLEFAEKIGVTATTISRYETGLIKISKYMDFVLEALDTRLIKKLQLPTEK